VLVSHDRHLLRATSDEFMIVADGTLRPFDGDLDDYRDWLFKTRLGQRAGAAAAAAKSGPPRPDAATRQRLAEQRKPIEARIRRLETLIDRHSARGAELTARLADPELYTEGQKDALKACLFEQADNARELERLEAEWLEQQAALDDLLG
jgi:ATP-binding cassette subfamily F protein 3